MDTIRIGTRGSALALAQTNFIANQIEIKTGLNCEIIVITTHGDSDQQTALSSGNITGLFTREIEQNLLGERIDLAVHSLKDLPLLQPAGLRIVAYPERENPADVLVYQNSSQDAGESTIRLKKNAVVGTGSPRRAAILANMRPDLIIRPIRGNVDTRLNKVTSGEFDATLLARAGLNRLRKSNEYLIFDDLPLDVFPSAPGQGCLALEIRENYNQADKIAEALNDPITEQCVVAERKLLQMFGGGCALPLGVMIKKLGEEFSASAFFASQSTVRYAQVISPTPEDCTTALYNKLNSIS